MKISHLGNNIQTIRKFRGMKQQELADKIGINMQSLSKIERGLNYPAYETLEKIMEVLNVTPNELLSGEWKYVNQSEKLSAENMAIIRKIAEHTSYIKEHVDTMVEARKVANKIVDERAKAIEYHDKITPMLEQIRYHIDKLELIVDDQMWTLPKYRELLFIR